MRLLAVGRKVVDAVLIAFRFLEAEVVPIVQPPAFPTFFAPRGRTKSRDI